MQGNASSATGGIWVQTRIASPLPAAQRCLPLAFPSPPERERGRGRNRAAAQRPAAAKRAPRGASRSRERRPPPGERPGAPRAAPRRARRHFTAAPHPGAALLLLLLLLSPPFPRFQFWQGIKAAPPCGSSDPETSLIHGVLPP